MLEFSVQEIASLKTFSTIFYCQEDLQVLVLCFLLLPCNERFKRINSKDAASLLSIGFKQ